MKSKLQFLALFLVLAITSGSHAQEPEKTQNSTNHFQVDLSREEISIPDQNFRQYLEDTFFDNDLGTPITAEMASRIHEP